MSVVKDYPPYLDYPKPQKIMTNGDKHRSMSDEELAKCIGHNSLCDWIQDNDPGWCDAQPVCSGCLVEWLKQPVEEVKE